MAGGQASVERRDDFAKVSNLPVELKTLNDSLIGLEYLAVVLKKKRAPQYACLLCNKLGLAHLINFKHRMKFIERFFPRVFSSLRNHKSNNKRGKKARFLPQIIVAIENKYGRLAPTVVEGSDADDFESRSAEILKAMESGPHFRETRRDHFTSLVDTTLVKKLRKIRKLPASKYVWCKPETSGGQTSGQLQSIDDGHPTRTQGSEMSAPSSHPPHAQNVSVSHQHDRNPIYPGSGSSLEPSERPRQSMNAGHSYTRRNQGSEMSAPSSYPLHTQSFTESQQYGREPFYPGSGYEPFNRPRPFMDTSQSYSGRSLGSEMSAPSSYRSHPYRFTESHPRDRGPSYTGSGSGYEPSDRSRSFNNSGYY